jgi:hypothetical protein
LSLLPPDVAQRATVEIEHKPTAIEVDRDRARMPGDAGCSEATFEFRSDVFEESGKIIDTQVPRLGFVDRGPKHRGQDGIQGVFRAEDEGDIASVFRIDAWKRRDAGSKMRDGSEKRIPKIEQGNAIDHFQGNDSDRSPAATRSEQDIPHRVRIRSSRDDQW